MNPLEMTTEIYCVIEIIGQLPDEWFEAFDGMDLSRNGGCLTGYASGQTELNRMLNWLFQRDIVINSVTCFDYALAKGMDRL